MRACHKLIADKAKDIAGAYYEQAAKNNVFYKMFPNQRAFIGLMWKHFIPVTKQILTKLLQSPTLPERDKDRIADALMKDWSINGAPMERLRQAGIIH